MRQRQRGAKGFGGAKDEHSEAHFALKTFPQRNLQWDANQTISIPVCVCVFSMFFPFKSQDFPVSDFRRVTTRIHFQIQWSPAHTLGATTVLAAEVIDYNQRKYEIEIVEAHGFN